MEKAGDKVYKKILNMSPDKLETVQKLNVLSSVIAGASFVENSNILDMIATDFELTRVSYRNVLRLLELF